MHTFPAKTLLSSSYHRHTVLAALSQKRRLALPPRTLSNCILKLFQRLPCYRPATPHDILLSFSYRYVEAAPRGKERILLLPHASPLRARAHARSLAAACAPPARLRLRRRALRDLVRERLVRLVVARAHFDGIRVTRFFLVGVSSALYAAPSVLQASHAVLRDARVLSNVLRVHTALMASRVWWKGGVCAKGDGLPARPHAGSPDPCLSGQKPSACARHPHRRRPSYCTRSTMC